MSNAKSLRLVAVAVLLCAGGICIAASHPATRYTTADGVMSIVGPAGWAPADFNNPLAGIMLSRERTQGYALVISEHKSDIKKGMTLTEYGDKLVGKARHQGVLEGITVSEPRSLTVNGCPAIQYKVHASIGNANVVFLQTFYETRTRFSQVLVWTSPSHFDQNRADFEQLITTFQQRPAPAPSNPTTQP